MKRRAFNSTLSAPSRQMRKVNPERERRRRAVQFDDTGEPDSYYEHITSQPCIVTGRVHVHFTHVLGMRGAGHGPEGGAPLTASVHRDFDDGLMSDERFQAKWKVSRADIRAWAQESWRAWQEEREP